MRGPYRTDAPYLRERLQQRVLRTAHRGAPRRAPDNTLESLSAAAAPAVDFVEVDVHLTRDGHLLLWHDEHFITPDGAYPIARHDLRDLRALGIPDGTIMTLPEAIEVARPHTGLMIDLKAPDLHDAIAHALSEADLRNVLVCGGYLDTLTRLKAALPHVATSLTPGAAFYARPEEELERLPDIDALTVYWRTVGPRLVRAARAHGVALLAWTVDHEHIARHLIHTGVDGITSNDLDLLERLPVT
ncbi:glycerophosphodiester phosphodiesterase (plasmid) [Deinococcus metallilatus]|nr:glycerophosphodiester phosphodiesterase [Deinococcus metallilatus]QBY06862.1 glycerophosphodiester phosphodiesterase [Deinococcus metallilatus]GMA14214.1 glycerophosphoryl diester phosphodiesterase [Deinococcus metallilatus]